MGEFPTCVDRMKVEEQEPLAGFEPTAWASNSGEKKNYLDHSATGHFIYSKGKQSFVQANI